MHRAHKLTSTVFALYVTAASLNLAAQAMHERRTMRPDDLFRIRESRAIAWSPDGLRATIELTRPGRTLDTTVPTNELALLDVKTRTLRTLTPNVVTDLGYFNAVWSPNGKRLAYLSVGSNAAVRPWIWTVGAKSPTPLQDLDLRVGFEDPPVVWIDDDRVALLAWDIGARKSGDFYFRIYRGRNVADLWRQAVDGKVASVSALESGAAKPTASPTARIVTIDLRTNARTTLARGGIHRLRVSPDHRLIEYLREDPGIPGQPVAAFFERADTDATYDAVNWGTGVRVIDIASGAEMAPSTMPAAVIRKVPAKAASDVIPPTAEARPVSVAPTGDAVIYRASGGDGTLLWLCWTGGQGTPLCQEIWKANEWLGEIRAASAQSIAYTSTDGTPLTAWLLTPSGYVTGTPLPLITIVYPGAVYGSTEPSSFALPRLDFEHPQLFAALGYAVLLPSMPPTKDSSAAHELPPLVAGVLPAVDAVVARGIADPDRVAVVGQSNGGFATLGLITQTGRFRSAIASASFSDMTSLYGTFYGQYRDGDAGLPQKGQVLRMVQLEKGFGLGAPPWLAPDRYRASSPVLSAANVQTPVMLVHGSHDFIPIQQAEEFFTALYRQDKRAVLVRYQGEWHTISNRENVLDLWRRMADWLSETLAPRSR